MKKIILLTFLVSAIGFAQKPIFTSAKVKAATVYFNAAELTQTTSVNLPFGTSEIVIKNVADYLNENTVQIGAPSSVTVLSVQFTQNYISEYEVDEKNPDTKKVRDSISYLQKELKKVENAKDSDAKTIELLDKNQQVWGANSGLNVTELMKMVDYYKLRRTELNNSYDAFEEKYNKLTLQLANLNKKLEVNTQKEEKSSQGKLILQVMNEVAGLVNLDINYITNSASWSPFYDLRAESIKEPINMMYKAQVVQNSGVDWKKVKLTLSSGNPNQNNQAPILSSWFLRYGNYYDISQVSVQNKLQSRGYGIKSKNEKADMEVAAAPVMADSSISNFTSISENQLNVSFDIDIPYDIMSNGKAHSVALKEIKLPASYKYYAAPRVEKEAFLLAEINDYSKYNLLQGEANIIFEGMYVGKTVINPNQTADTLNLSMGRDKKISIKREKVVDKSGTKFLSSYKEQTFTYDITVRNNKKEEVNMLLKDQYPLSSDKEITVELLDDGKAKVNPETGIMTWELKLAPNETKKIRISYKVKYPKDKIIDNL
ncbi:MAG: DUF4139 domain-containing protein [Flavobacterium sp.]|uniref:DUF4139 domain-containing protein n=1 Tax=Flavobacterium sp. TaxID=239 RepID=UPI0022CC44C7|nr:DUF4139 domain-containing protein [Flavobacterium sp.]MCZ8196339.1 DUF4139 domain-containing protein [Flavobacterium sp.]